jgi:hypothetical protein
MATLAKLLQVDMDLPSMAKRLAEAGRGKDSILAHINPKEMALLKKHGGSGKINPKTGIMEFDDTGDYGSIDSSFTPAPAPDISAAPAYANAQLPKLPTPVADTANQFNAQTNAPAPTAPPPVTPSNTNPTDMRLAAGTQQTPMDVTDTTKSKGIGQTIADYLKPAGESASAITKAIDPFTPYISAGYNIYQATQANKAQKAAQEQATANQQRLEALQAPAQAQAAQLTQKGNDILSQGTAGGITAAQQQNLETLAAQQAQSRSSSGQGNAGTAAAQDAAILQRLAQQYAQENITQGLQLIQGGNAINQGANTAIASAINTGYQQSTDANNAANQFYKNIGSYLPTTNVNQNPTTKPKGNP